MENGKLKVEEEILRGKISLIEWSYSEKERLTNTRQILVPADGRMWASARDRRHREMNDRRDDRQNRTPSSIPNS